MRLRRNIGATCAVTVVLALLASACEPANNARDWPAGSPEAPMSMAMPPATMARTKGLVMTALVSAQPEPADRASASISTGWPAACAAYLRVVGYCADRLAPSNPVRAGRLQAAVDRLSVDWMDALAQHREITVNGMECTTALTLFTRVEAPIRGCGGNDLPLPPPPVKNYPITCTNYFNKVQACISKYRSKSAAFEIENLLSVHRERLDDLFRRGDIASMNGSCAMWSGDLKDDAHDRGLDC